MSRNSFLADVRTGWRAYRNAPLHSTLAAFVMALGIATTTAMYATSRAVTTTVPPIPDPGRVTRLYVADSTRPIGRRPPEGLESAALLARSAGLGIVTSVISDSVRVSIDGCAASQTPVDAAHVDTAFFDVARVRPGIGRAWTDADLDRGTPIVIGDALWRRMCAPGTSPIGRIVRVNGTPADLIGIMPEGFWLSNPSVELWMPFAKREAHGPRDLLLRLDEGPTLEDINRCLRGEPQGLALALTDPAFSRDLQALVGLVGPALLVLLVSCANATAILLVRATRRARDLAIKASLGAGRLRLVRETIFEAAVVGAVAGLIAVPLMWTATFLIRHELGTVAPALARRIAIDGRVAIAAFAACAFAALLTGLLPAIRASRTDTAPLLSGTPRRAFIRRGHYGVSDLLVVVQVALGVVLIVVIALFTSVFDVIGGRSLGKDPDGLVSAELTTEDAASIDNPLLAGVVGALRTTPGVSGVALSDSPPLPLRRSSRIVTHGEGTPSCLVTVRGVTPEYFALLGLSIKAGRIFDANSQGVAVASASLAALCWSGQGAGHRVRVESSGNERWMDVIGIVEDAGDSVGLSAMLPADLYVPYVRNETQPAIVLLAAPTRAADVSREASERVRQASGGHLALDTPATLRAIAEREMRQPRVLTRLLSALGLVAWLLATVGLHSSIAQALTARWRDFGIRAALGARPLSLVAATVGRHVPLFVTGAAAGTIVTIAITSMVWADAVRIGGAGPRTWLTILGTLIVSAIAASAGPALRASHLDPISALRRDDE